jgi:hypothetical protein
VAVRNAARSAYLRPPRVERLATELTRVVAILRSEADA